ncbi:MAG: CoA transferase [Chloroflexi bacterium]|nr:CoA transferase [Chloroflexota bacterium]
MSMGANKLPLEGIRVLELAEGWAGPWSPTLLADLGAEVIKIEAIQRLDNTRGPAQPPPGTPSYPNKSPGPRPWNICLTFIVCSRNKLSATLDLSRPLGLTLFKELVRLSDVVCTNMVTGVPEKLGISYARLREVKPDIVMLASCGFGATGPYATHVSMGGSMDAAAGHLWLRNYPDADPTEVSHSTHLDSVNSVTGAFAVLTALFRLRKVGKGQFIDTSGCETFMPHVGEAIMDYTMNGQVHQPMGNAHSAMAPHGCYRCAGEDRWVAISVATEKEWRALCQAMGRPALAADPRFADRESRCRNRAELDRLVESWTREIDHYEAMRRLEEVGVPAGAVLDNSEVYRDPHFSTRGFFQPVEHPDMGTYPLPGVIWKMTRTPGSIRLRPPTLGEHNEYVFKGLLSLSDSRYAQLDREQYIGTVPLVRPL